MSALLFVAPLAIGIWQWVVIAALVMLLFGGKKIPEVMRGMGRGIKEFKDAMNTDYSADKTAKTDETIKSPDTTPTDETTK